MILAIGFLVAGFYLGYKWAFAACSESVRRQIERGDLIVPEGRADGKPEFRVHVTCDACGIGAYIGVDEEDAVPSPWYCPRCDPHPSDE